MSATDREEWRAAVRALTDQERFVNVRAQAWGQGFVGDATDVDGDTTVGGDV